MYSLEFVQITRNFDPHFRFHQQVIRLQVYCSQCTCMTLRTVEYESEEEHPPSWVKRIRWKQP